jgi:bacillithiol biosynthesis cysteine-adding enzyme BshC
MQFYRHRPGDLGAALKTRGAHTYPRGEVSAVLSEYNTRIGASAETMGNIAALGNPGTMCVITGQQAGFMGGPAYTVYKIATAVRLAAAVEADLGARCVPVFWLATEDHDFGEVNHAYFVRRDGEIGSVGFDWAGKGAPIADLPLTPQIEDAISEFWAQSAPAPHTQYAQATFAPQSGEDYATWNARVWSRIFADQGLIVVEPRTLRGPGAAFLASAIRQSDEIQSRLDQVSAQLTEAGYRPQLTSDYAGMLYTFENGMRVRIEEGTLQATDVAAAPDHYSTDAALRPVFADAVLPILASVLGPGETAYQGMLSPIYELFGIPQPVLYPRKSYTVVSKSEAERLGAYQTDVRAVLAGTIDSDAIFERLLPESELAIFGRAERELEAALKPLKPYIESIDPSMGRTWEQTRANAERSLHKLQDRAVKARLSQLGFSKGELRHLQNVVLPRNRLQERVLPLPHFLGRYGPRFVKLLLSAGELGDFAHHVLVVEDTDD